ncbi:MAG: glycine zipper family protein [Gammaproteobacteria bacterium]
MKFYDLRAFIPAAIVLASLVACASSTPVIYQSKSAASVDEAQVRQDIAACQTEAQSKGLNPTSGAGAEVAKGTVRGGAMGTATGAVTGAIGGNPGRGATYGAAAGATAGLLNSLFKGSKPNSTYRRYVERCLADFGYDIVGWN